jgi:hypothetical protein
MKKLLFLLVLLVGNAFSQTVTLPTYIFGSGINYGNPGFGSSLDFDYELGKGLYSHIVIGDLVIKHGTISGVIRPGFEWRFHQNQTHTINLVAIGDVGPTIGTTKTLTQYTTGAAIEVSLMKNHYYLRFGVSVVGGSLITTNTTTVVQLVPSVELRIPIF